MQKIVFILFFLIGFSLSAQYKYEREHRIRKDQFPEKALFFIKDKLEGARKIRFYKETDSTKVSYEAKFKRDRLRYSVEFSADGNLEDIEILIKEVDIPEETMIGINDYLEKEFSKFRIRKMQQQYPVGTNDEQTTLRNAFQNLILPSIKYELIVTGKKDRNFAPYEVLFDAKGNFEQLRKSLPPNYDHVLY